MFLCTQDLKPKRRCRRHLQLRIGIQRDLGDQESTLLATGQVVIVRGVALSVRATMSGDLRL